MKDTIGIRWCDVCSFPQSYLVVIEGVGSARYCGGCLGDARALGAKVKIARFPHRTAA